MDSKNIVVSNVSWTKENDITENGQAELLSMPPESGFQSEQNNLKQ